MQYKEDRQYENKGQELINEIELYRGSHNKLPETVKDINEVETMGNGPYYEKVNETTYKVYFWAYSSFCRLFLSSRYSIAQIAG